MSDNDLIRRGDVDKTLRDWQMKLHQDGHLVMQMTVGMCADILHAIPAAEVAVKPLAWVWSERVQGWRADCLLTRDVFIAYETSGKWSAGSQWFGTTTCLTADDAKSHLDQMRSTRIRSALTVTPHDPTKVQALVEAAEAMLDAFCIHEDSEQIAAYEALCAALAAMKEG